MKRQSLLTVFLPLLFLMPSPILGQTTGPMTIIEDTTLTLNHEGNIIIGADDITLDCNNRTVSSLVSGTGVGIELSNRTKVTVKNCHVQYFDTGFRLFESDRNRFHYNTAEGNADTGFGVVSNSNKNKFEENTAIDNGGNGFSVSLNSNENKFHYNIANGNRRGITARGNSNKNEFEENTANGNQMDGFQLSLDSNKNKFHYNTAEGNGRNGFGVFSGSSNNTFKENTVTDNGTGRGGGNGFEISPARGGPPNNNTLKKNTAAGNSLNGFRIADSSNNTFDDNTAHDNGDNGFVLFNSDKNKFQKNTATDNGNDGFALFNSDKNKFQKNTATDNGNNGFNVVGTSELNTFEKNEGCNNTGFDALDGSTGLGNKWKGNFFCLTSGFTPTGPLKIKLSVENLTTAQPIRRGQTVDKDDLFQVTVTTNGVDCAGQWVVTRPDPVAPPIIIVQVIPFIIGPTVGNNSATGFILAADNTGDDYKISASCNGASPRQFHFDSFEFFVVDP